MVNSAWMPDGYKIKHKGVSYQWPLALRNFVLPLKDQAGWIENSKDVTNTKLKAREWFGLIIHSIALSDMNGGEFLVATEDSGGDGAIVKIEDGENMAVLVEQTLVTHREEGSLDEVFERRITAKSSRGGNYALNKHLIILCNKNGDMIEEKLATLVSRGAFDIVNVIGYQSNDKGDHFLSYIFDKDLSTAAIHKIAIYEDRLWKAAIDIYDSEDKG